MRNMFAAMAVASLCACSPATEPESEALAPAPDVAASEATAEPAPASALDALPSWSFADAQVFPATRGLSRSEDGVALPDGALIVTEQVNGMVAIAPDGTITPFGNFADVGYVHRAPDHLSAPNGVTMDPDGEHMIVAELYNGAIYSVNIATGATELLYTHPYGVNIAIKDSTGAIWFTQSTENSTGPDTEARIYATMDTWAADGVLFRIPPGGGEARVVLDGLMFPNGMVIDEAAGVLYLAETTGHRVTAYDVDLAAGTASNPRVIADIVTPDNIEMDADGLLWVASPIGGRVIVIDPASGASHIVFHNQTPANDAIVADVLRLYEAREPGGAALVTPDAWAPMPGALTGMIFSPDGGTVYFTGLGDALLKLER